LDIDPLSFPASQGVVGGKAKARSETSKAALSLSFEGPAAGWNVGRCMPPPPQGRAWTLSTSCLPCHDGQKVSVSYSLPRLSSRDSHQMRFWVCLSWARGSAMPCTASVHDRPAVHERRLALGACLTDKRKGLTQQEGKGGGRHAQGSAALDDLLWKDYRSREWPGCLPAFALLFLCLPVSAFSKRTTL
jgi:hypothetical protein